MEWYNRVQFSDLNIASPSLESQKMYLFLRAFSLLIIISIDAYEIFRANILDLADEYLAGNANIYVYKTIRVEYRSILLDICFQCEYLILEIGIDIYILGIDREVLESKENFSSIFQ